MTQEKLEQLKATAAEVRRGILTEVHAANSGHPGGSLSVADIITYLYSEVLRVDPENPRWEDRDRLVLSKGHTCPALYAMLAEKGFFPKEELTTFRAIGSRLQGHPDMNKAPGIDFSAGSLGQGVSAACGMALAGKIGNKDYRVYTILGDGEIEEGQVWEAAMFADHYKLDNLCFIIDNNDLQIDGRIGEVSSPYPIDEKFRAFGIEVFCCDGHDFNALEETFQKVMQVTGKPSAVIAKTIKGKGVSFMEDQAGWHGKAPNDAEYEQGMKELEVR